MYRIKSLLAQFNWLSLNVDFFANNIRCAKKENRRKYWRKCFDQNEKKMNKIKQKILKEDWTKYATFHSSPFGDLFFWT
jgi:hypothetical protein